MVPETHELEFQTSEELSMFVRSHEFLLETAQKLRDQYEVDVALGEPKAVMQGDKEIVVEKLMLSYTRNNAGGLKDAIDFLFLPFISRGLEATEIKGAIPRPKSDYLGVLEKLLPKLPRLKFVRARDVKWLRNGMSARAQQAGVQGEMLLWKRKLGRRGIQLLDAEWNPGTEGA